MKTHHSRFYLIITIIIFVIVLLGFTPSFFLRWFFEQPKRLQFESFPWLFVIHGTVMTAWFVLLIVQSGLINLKKHQLHMKLGMASIVLAILVVVTAYPVAMGLAPREIAMGTLDPENTDMLRFLSIFWYHDMLSLIVFSSLFVAGILYRRKPALHRTMMLFASLAFIGPAIGRLIAWLLPDIPGEVFVPMNLLLVFSLPIAIFIYDWRTQKAFPKYAFIGFFVIFLMVVLNATLPQTDWGLALYMQHLK